MTLALEIAHAISALHVKTAIDLIEVEVEVPGVGAAAAYAAGDQMGTLLKFQNVARIEGGSGVIVSAIFIDRDDEGLGKTLHIFRRPVVLAIDNAAYTMPVEDTDVRSWRKDISFSIFTDHLNSQTSEASPLLYYKCGPGETSLYGALETEGADNIAAGMSPVIVLLVARD